MYAPSNEIELSSGLLFPEGPSFGRDGTLYVAEIGRSCITAIDKTGCSKIFADLGGGPNGTAFGPDGCLYVCNNGGLAFSGGRPAGRSPENSGGRIERIRPDGHSEILFTACDERPLEAPNDIAFDAVGGFYFTDSHHGTRASRPLGQIYYGAPGARSIRLAANDLQLPNGIAVVPDGKAVIAVETIPRLVVKFDIVRPGVLGGKQVLATLPEGCLPDGIALDVEGNIICAGLGLGILISVNDRGEQVRTVKMACTDPTNLTFGPDGKRLYVTEGVLGRVVMVDWPTAGALLGVEKGFAPDGASAV
jgi:gluconolactonase